jgi:hypothetical protein
MEFHLHTFSQLGKAYAQESFMKDREQSMALWGHTLVYLM